MKLQFDANQDCQLAAIEALTMLFEGQPHMDATVQFSLCDGFAALP